MSGEEDKEIARLLRIASGTIQDHPKEEVYRRSINFDKGRRERLTKKDRLDNRLSILYRFIEEFQLAPGTAKIPAEMVWRLFTAYHINYRVSLITRQFFFKRFSKIFELKRREKYRCYLIDNTNGIFDISKKGYSTLNERPKKAQKKKKETPST